VIPTVNVRSGLYAIIDVDLLARAGREVLPFAERVLAAGALAALQLRAKSLGARDALQLARQLAERCERAGVPFFVNDRPDLALLAGARGVHVGTDDLPVREVRRFAPTLLVGTSTHNPHDVIEALATDADYVAFGPVFATSSKRDHAPVTGLEALRNASLECASARRPLVAIGGITLESAPRIRETGATSGAVISGLLVEEVRVTDNARALHVALGGA
jgi:thiamine-phosphate pyrophosphorylase